MTVTSSSYDRRENEFYETPEWVTEAVLRHFPLSGRAIWEPAAGNHMIADVLRKHSNIVWTSDIARYDRDHDEIRDFLAYDGCEVVTDTFFDVIFTNPPYGKGNRLAVAFIEKALERCSGWVFMLVTAKFDFGKTRQHLFRDNPRFHAKIALIDRISWTGDGVTGTEDHCVMVWRPRTEMTRAPVMIYEGKMK